MRSRPLIDMTEAFTPEGIAKLKKKQVLVFERDGEKQAYKIVSLVGGRVYARQTRLYKPEEVDVVDREKK